VILLRLISWPYLRKHVLRTLLTTIGIVLGVGLFVAMQTANQGVLAAFSETIDRVAGKTDLQITAGENGFGEEALEQVQSSGVVSVAVPVIEAVVDTDRHGTLLILGVDMTGDRSLRAYDTEGPEDSAIDDPLIFLAQADSLLVSKKFADRSGLHVDSRLSLGTAEGDKDFVVRGVMRSSHLADAYGGNLAVMDIYAAQKMFGRGRTFDSNRSRAEADNRTRRGTPATDRSAGTGFEVQPPATRGRQAESMLAGYTALVNISSAFALFIGMFIVYSAFATAVTQRRSEIGILRSLGATTSQIPFAVSRREPDHGRDRVGGRRDRRNCDRHGNLERHQRAGWWRLRCHAGGAHRRNPTADVCAGDGCRNDHECRLRPAARQSGRARGPGLGASKRERSAHFRGRTPFENDGGLCGRRHLGNLHGCQSLDADSIRWLCAMDGRGARRQPFGGSDVDQIDAPVASLAVAIEGALAGRQPHPGAAPNVNQRRGPDALDRARGGVRRHGHIDVSHHGGLGGQ
jgi:ABC-type lipoprotein release transport system permease subunit